MKITQHTIGNALSFRPGEIDHRKVQGGGGVINHTLFIDDFQSLLDAAVAKWGKPILIVLAIEELSELQTELCHHLRGRNANVAEELADTILMILQIENILDNQVEVDKMIRQKVARLRERIAAPEQAEEG